MSPERETEATVVSYQVLALLGREQIRRNVERLRWDYSVEKLGFLNGVFAVIAKL
jgi:hypothetical protein